MDGTFPKLRRQLREERRSRHASKVVAQYWLRTSHEEGSSNFLTIRQRVLSQIFI